MFDQAYVSSLVKTVLHNIYTDTSGTLVLGTVAIPTPPANVGKSKYNLYITVEITHIFMKKSEYDQDIPQSHTADQPSAQ